MHVVLSPVGTRGDIQPMVALARGLRRAGHVVTFCAPPDYREWITREGLRFVPVGRDYASLIRELTRSTRHAFRTLAEEVAAQFEALEPVISEADVVVSASLNWAAPSLAEKAGVPYRMVIYSVASIPSWSHPVPVLPFHGLPGWVNALSWQLGKWGARLSFGAAIERERRRRGMPPLGDFFAHLGGEETLLAFDDRLAPIPGDVRHSVVATGAWLLEQDEPLAPELESFLQSGPPPVYLGFGSMPDPDPARTTRTVLEAAGRAGTRLVLSSGWAALGEAALPEGVLRIGPVNHRALLPRCAGAVHHGGAGTTLAAALAGIPQLLVPHEVDQFFHDRCIQRLGLGPRGIPRRRLSADGLTAGLRALTSGPYASAARDFSGQVEREGVARAVRRIELAALGGRRTAGDALPTWRAAAGSAG